MEILPEFVTRSVKRTAERNGRTLVDGLSGAGSAAQLDEEKKAQSANDSGHDTSPWGNPCSRALLRARSQEAAHVSYHIRGYSRRASLHGMAFFCCVFCVFCSGVSQLKRWNARRASISRGSGRLLLTFSFVSMALWEFVFFVCCCCSFGPLFPDDTPSL